MAQPDMTRTADLPSEGWRKLPLRLSITVSPTGLIALCADVIAARDLQRKTRVERRGGRAMKWPRSLRVPRDPDVTVGPPDDLYLRRWYVIPRNRWLNIYLHHFLRSDDDRALHDHPWWNISLLLSGFYLEVTPSGRSLRVPWRLAFRRATDPHRVELIAHRPVWTLFITGPEVREWGFHCPNGWRPQRDYLERYEGGNQIGRGCE